MDQKTCTKCGIPKSLDEFRTRKLKDGTTSSTSWCRVCLNESSKLSMRARSVEPDYIEARKKRDADRYEKIKADPVLLEAERERKRVSAQRPEAKAASVVRSKRWRASHPGAQVAASRKSHEKRKETEDYRIRRIIAQWARR